MGTSVHASLATEKGNARDEGSAQIGSRSQDLQSASDFFLFLTHLLLPPSSCCHLEENG